VFRYNSSTTLVGVALLALQATAFAQQPGQPGAPQLPGTLTQQPGTIVEMVLVPCLPGTPRDKCGVTLKLVKGSASFTTSNGQTISLSQANQVVSINGNSVVSQSSQPDSILNFASTGSTGTTTASIGGGGGGAGTIGSLGASGGGGGGGGSTTTASSAPSNSGGSSGGGGGGSAGGGGGGGGGLGNLTTASGPTTPNLTTVSSPAGPGNQ
jgi:hypothetical protein